MYHVTQQSTLRCAPKRNENEYPHKTLHLGVHGSTIRRSRKEDAPCLCTAEWALLGKGSAHTMEGDSVIRRNGVLAMRSVDEPKPKVLVKEARVRSYILCDSVYTKLPE